jgi:hypothetical protein
MSVINLNSGQPTLQAMGGENLMAACAFGYTDGCYELGLSFFEGSNGFSRDVAGAVLIWEVEACNKGHAMSCAAAGFELEHNEEIKRDPVKAVRLYRQACDARDPIGCNYLGYAYARGVGGLARDPAKAAQLYTTACDGGSGSACSRLSAAYREGSGVQRDDARADALARKGCELKSPLCGQAADSSAPGAQGAAFRVARMQLGVDTVASVERDIRARGGEPMTGGSGPAKFRINALSGDFQDAGPDIMAVNYDFDATGPAGRLIALTIVRHRAVNVGPAPYASLVAERQAAIAKELAPLQQKSPTEFLTTASGVQVTMHVNADTGYLYETYRLDGAARSGP